MSFLHVIDLKKITKVACVLIFIHCLEYGIMFDPKRMSGFIQPLAIILDGVAIEMTVTITAYPQVCPWFICAGFFR